MSDELKVGYGRFDEVKSHPLISGPLATLDERNAATIAKLRTQLAAMTAERDRLQTCLGDCMQAAIQATAQPRQPLSEWIACSEQMPILSEGDDELPVYTWDGESVKADEFGFLFEQPAGPAVGGWVCIGADFLNNLSGTVTHWMPRNMPAAPERAITGGKP